MNKKIVGKDELLPKMIEGMKEIASIVKRTLGPGGLPIILQRLGQSVNGDPLGPRVTKDGVSVAEEGASPDPLKDLTIQAVKSICSKTNTEAGDGTTTAIVLGEAIFNETLMELDINKDLNPQLVRESVESAAKEAMVYLSKQAKPVKKPKVISEVATISANGDSEIGEIIGEAFAAVGAEGVVTVDEGSSVRTTLEIVEGYQVQRGAEARDGFFNSKDKTQFEAMDARVLIYDGKLTSYTHLIEALTKIVTGKTIPPVVILANDFSSEVINWMLIQKLDGGLNIVAVRGPNVTNVRSGYYDDIAAMSGGERLGNGSRSLDAAEADDFGLVKKVIVDKYTTTFYDGQGEEEAVLNRVDQLKAMKEKAESPYDAQILSDRLAALTQGIAKIGVGGSTDLEIKEKYDRIEDALNAARAAISEGVIAGGGVTFLKLATDMSQDTVGRRILSRALKTPFYQILENIGHKLNQEEYEQIMNNKGFTYDARNRKVVNAFKSGILDPVKVSKSALENAVSIAALLSTAGGAIVYIRDDK